MKGQTQNPPQTRKRAEKEQLTGEVGDGVNALTVITEH